jgi:hypothetical protein
MLEQPIQFKISPLAKGVKSYYGKEYKKYEKMDLSIEDMKAIILAFAIRWDSKRGLSCQNNQ